MGGPPARLAAALGLLAVLGASTLRAGPLAAQATEPGPMVGFVRDAESGGPILGARLRLDPGGRTAEADSAGGFIFPDPPDGPVTLVAEAFGYASFQLTVPNPGQGPALVVSLRPDPLALEGIEVPVETQAVLRGAVAGVVRDTETGAPLVGADVTIPELGRGVRATTREAGTFVFQRLPPDSHLLLVERLGYESAYVQVQLLDRGGSPLDIGLEPDSALLVGVARIQQRLRTIRRAVGGLPIRAVERDRLAASPWLDVRTYLSADLGVRPRDCRRPGGVPDCIPRANGTLSPMEICVDGIPATGGLTQLDGYFVQDFELIEVVAGGRYLHLFTTGFFETHGYTPDQTPRLCPWPERITR